MGEESESEGERETRLPDGRIIRRVKPDVPPPATRELAKSATRANLDQGQILTKCPCCGRETAIASDVLSVRDEGLCEWCFSYHEGTVDHVILYRNPTASEVLARAEGGYGLTRVETSVVLDGLRKVYGGSECSRD